MSESVIDILGYRPAEVQGKSCFDYFHPHEIPFARSVHSRGILLDKAAVLHYCRIRARNGQWISCECCFTVVHDVLVACTSIYRKGARSVSMYEPQQGAGRQSSFHSSLGSPWAGLTETGRAMEAPQIRRIFSCSPRDPRYHMLEHLSPKFRMPPMEREPRAALILNRFTRTLTVMFATNAVSSILGVRPDQIRNKSFYECIQENCLSDALECLESAKANDSIAYLRFWYRDPRREEDLEMGEDDDIDQDQGESSLGPDVKPTSETAMDIDSTSSTIGASPRGLQRERFPQDIMAEPPGREGRQQSTQPLELEAVVSCTSDGLVVVLRKARPPIPADHPPLLPFDFENGLFAAPWGQQSITPSFPPESLHNFQPPLLPQFMPLRENVKAAGGPPMDQLMRSIRDVAVFAWALVGINGNVAAYGRGLPTAESQLPGNRRESDTRSTNTTRDSWGGRPDAKDAGLRADDDNGDGLDNALRRPAAPAAGRVRRGSHHRGSGPICLPPNHPRQHPDSRLNASSTRELVTCHPSSWTGFTDTADRGHSDRRYSYGVTTSPPNLAEGYNGRQYRWP